MASGGLRKTSVAAGLNLGPSDYEVGYRIKVEVVSPAKEPRAPLSLCA
jgi:hypothetical protein